MTVGDCAYWACVLEATAAKPGNVCPSRSFPDLCYQDLIRSAEAIRPVIDNAPGQKVGITVLRCIQATRKIVNTNTNLGIVLLLAPLAVSEDISSTLRSLTIGDAINVYDAIRLAKPGGLGRVDQQDVEQIPNVTLRQAMALAADRDRIAKQYVNNFEDVFQGADQFERWRARSVSDLRLEDLVIRLHLWFMAAFPDSLIVRKRSLAEAVELQAMAQAALNNKSKLPDLDAWFNAEFPQRNPGTTADLVCASLFMALRRGMITLPTPTEWPEFSQCMPRTQSG